MNEKNNFEDELNFKNVVKSPSRMFGLIFPYYFVLFLIVGIYFIKHLNETSLNRVPPHFTDSLDINVDVDVKKGGVMPAVDLAIISNPDKGLVEKGKNLYETTCSSCHGTEGKGDGPAAAALNPPPRNFHQVDGWTNGREFNNIFKTLAEGVPGTGMIAYEYLSVEDRIAIIHFIRTFGEFPAIDDKSIAELDKTYELSKGVITPSNITLEMAENKIAEENQLSEELLKNYYNKLSAYSDRNTTELFDKYVSDKAKVLLIFHRDKNTDASKNVFISRVIMSPTESGFKQTITTLSKDKLSKIYDMLVKVVS